ncbi:MAG: hypothetical protein MJZ76_01620 [Bacteroidales bacterium]|nr:hypothetical protein [Bacteroidales bacterium]
MPSLKIIETSSKFSLKIPHKILINNIFIGLIQKNPITINLPEGEYTITIQSMIPLFSASLTIQMEAEQEATLKFGDREKFWDLLLIIDLILWFAKFFLDKFDAWQKFNLSHNWALGYTIFTNGIFILWLIYEWMIRKKYFKMVIDNS